MILTAMALATCFELVGPKYSYLPKVLCFTGMAVNIEQGIMYIDSDSMPESMAAELVRHNEDYYSFKAAKTLFEKDGGICSYETVGVLNLKGKVDNYGSIDTLEMWVDYDYTIDNCHSPMRSERAIYQLKQ